MQVVGPRCQWPALTLLLPNDTQGYEALQSEYLSTYTKKSDTVDPDLAELFAMPILQSGGVYDLDVMSMKPCVVVVVVARAASHGTPPVTRLVPSPSRHRHVCRSPTGTVETDVMLFTVGARYQSMGSMVGRTYLFNPSPTQEEAYEFMCDVQHDVVDNLKAGEKISTVIAAVVDRASKRKGGFFSYLSKDFGQGIGFTLESSTRLVASNDTVIRCVL